MLHLDWALKTSGMANGSYSLTESRAPDPKILIDLKNEVLSGVQRDRPKGNRSEVQFEFAPIQTSPSERGGSEAAQAAPAVR